MASVGAKKKYNSININNSRVRTGANPQAAGGELNTCGTMLRDWDGVSLAERAEPAVWAIFQEELLRVALEDTLGEDGFRFYTAAAIAGRSAIDANLDHFVDDRPAAVTEALVQTCKRLEQELGSDRATWNWGQLHPLHIRHPFSDASKLLKNWSLPNRDWGGSHQTVNQAGYSWFSEDLSTTWMASLRIVMPMGDVGKATFSYPGGQSGMPKHPHFQDLYDPFVSGQALPLWFHDTDVAEHTMHTLTIAPE